MPRRRLALLLAIPAIVAVACGGPPPERKPIAEEKIGTFDAIPTRQPMSADASAPSPSSTVPEPPDPQEPRPPKVADLCPPKGQRIDLSRLASKAGCPRKPQPRPAILSEARSFEQLLSSTSSGSNDREAVVLKLALAYGHLECVLKEACESKKDRNANQLPDDIPLADARRKTEQYCATLREEFPRSKRQCP